MEQPASSEPISGGGDFMGNNSTAAEFPDCSHRDEKRYKDTIVWLFTTHTLDMQNLFDFDVIISSNNNELFTIRPVLHKQQIVFSFSDEFGDQFGILIDCTAPMLFQAPPPVGPGFWTNDATMTLHYEGDSVDVRNIASFQDVCATLMEWFQLGYSERDEIDIEHALIPDSLWRRQDVK